MAGDHACATCRTLSLATFVTDRRMKLNILSDLHLGVDPFERPNNDADVIVLIRDLRPKSVS